MIPKTIIHLLSGGLDSVTMLYDLKQQGHLVHALMFWYGQQHEQELRWAYHHAERCRVKHTTLDLPKLGGLTEANWIVPNRNAIFLSIAVNVAVQAGADTVTIGCNAEDEAMFPDCRGRFIDAMNEAVKMAGYEIEICAPYKTWPKWRIGGLAQELGIDIGAIWTCYKGGEKPCGECPACQKLQGALANMDLAVAGGEQFTSEPLPR